MGEVLHIPMPDRTLKVRVTGTAFVDPDGQRLKV
jgi:sarcosine oxidase subunit alpha